jgi:hypothetical protein
LLSSTDSRKAINELARHIARWCGLDLLVDDDVLIQSTTTPLRR